MRANAGGGIGDQECIEVLALPFDKAEVRSGGVEGRGGGRTLPPASTLLPHCLSLLSACLPPSAVLLLPACLPPPPVSLLPACLPPPPCLPPACRLPLLSCEWPCLSCRA